MSAYFNGLIMLPYPKTYTDLVTDNYAPMSAFIGTKEQRLTQIQKDWRKAQTLYNLIK